MKKIFIAISALLMLTGGAVALHNSALAEGEQQKIIEKSDYSIVVRFRIYREVELRTRFPREEECSSDEKTVIRRSEYDLASGELVKWCGSIYEIDYPVVIKGTGNSEKDFEEVKKVVEEKNKTEGGFKGINEEPWIEKYVVDTDYNNTEEKAVNGIKKPEDCEKYQVYDFYFKPVYRNWSGVS